MKSDSILLYYLIAFVVLALLVSALLVWAIVAAMRNRKRNLQTPLVMPGHAEKQAAAASPAPTQDAEVMRVMRDRQNGAIYVEVERNAYRELTDIRSPEVGRLVLQAVSDLVRFTRGVTPAVASSANVAPPPLVGQRPTSSPPASALQNSASGMAPAEISPTSGSLAKRGEALIKPNGIPRSSDPSRPADSERADRTRSAPAGEARSTSTGTGPLRSPTGASDIRPSTGSTGPLVQPTQQRIDMKSFWERALSRPAASGVTGPRPLADELEDVLRELVRSSPKALPVEVHFKTADDGHLVIGVNGIEYASAEDIADPIGRQLVLTVIRKWESA